MTTRALEIRNRIFDLLCAGIQNIPYENICCGRTNPFSKDELPAINVRLGDSDSNNITFDTTEHDQDIEISIEVCGEDVDAKIEDIREEIINLVFVDTSLSGLCLNLIVSKSHRETDEASGSVGKAIQVITANYRLPIGQA